MTSTDLNRPICVLGLGLIGGSLLRDLAGRNHPAYGYDRSTASVRAAGREGFDTSSDLTGILSRAEEEGALIVLATPMPAIAGLLDALGEHAPSCGFTDVVSVKTEISQLVHQRGMDNRYVGGHPMAGTANSGWTASHKGLFTRAAWVVTYDHAENADREWIELWSDVVRLVATVGAEAVPARVAHHDAAVARISHLVHVFAETLAVVGDNGGTLAQSLAASSFRDSTRVASTQPALVQAMCETNAPAVVSALDEAMEILAETREALSGPEPDLSGLAEAGYSARERFEARHGARRESVSPIKISSRPLLRLQPGTKGWIRHLEHAESLGARIEIF
ncbi:prephenate dehydrogenase [Corynebacterium alimapuense]|uniref:Prephenate dehydrogenase n=1 Tax=Corynebacterium alimapuense TaxID=1576874 RepID=A0A3M8K4W5_9CORY|nr:prephenate dehydrogenase [Corynebacterium alimapuense]RNE48241.1 prephenate dehydrogenase [Corynebacterium alimapuense]